MSTDESLPIDSIGTCALCLYHGPGPRHDCNPHHCKLCGKPRYKWQVFCGAACSARWEAGERPAETTKETP